MSTVERALLAIFVFWSGIAMGAVAFAALLELTGAQWAGPLRTIAARFRRFLLVSFVLYGVLLIAGGARFHWRDAAALAAVYGIAVWFGREGASTRTAVIYLIAYAIGSGLLAVDLLMSLDPAWTSTLFPAYVSTASLYTAIAAIALAGASSRRTVASALERARAHDLLKLLFGFALLWMYLVWAQYVVIWYGNQPDEVGYFIRRMNGGWSVIAWIVVATRLIVPSLTLLTSGKRPQIMIWTAMAVCVGFLLECFVLVG